MRRFLLASLVLAFALCHWAGSAFAADDTTPPTLVSATRYSTNLYQIFVSFSERMDTNTTLVPANYRLRSGTTTANIIDSDIAFGTAGSGTNRGINYILTADTEVVLEKDWVLSAVKVADTNGNVIVTNASANTILVKTAESVIPPYSDFWDYLDGGFENSAAQLFDNSWAQPDYFVGGSWNTPGGFQKPSTFFLGWGGTVPPGGGTTMCCYDNNDTEVASTTSYFRKTFTVDNGSLFNSVFTMRAVVNDGAVFYLNGKEFYRTNIAANVTPTYKTLATKAGNNSWSPFITLPINGLINFGDNLIAVELHQKAAADGDAGFDIELVQTYTNRAVGAASIIVPPQDLTVIEGNPATFSVAPDGKPPFKYQWYRIPTGTTTATKLTGEVSRTLTITNTPLSYNSNKFYVEVTASTGGVKASTNALLTVTPDKVAPFLVSASLDDSVATTDYIVVTFSELMNLAAATNKANYTVTNLTGQVAAITSVTNIDGRRFGITFTSPLLATTRYVVTTKNLTDNAGVANALVSGNQATVGGSFSLVDMESEWRYYQNATNPPVGATWTAANYTEVPGWLTGNALFYVEDATLPANKNTPLALTQGAVQTITYYFRKTFDFGGPTNGVTLSLSHIVDDGMVIWLNGQVAYRFNMSTTPATPLYTTLATVNVDNAVLVSGLKLPLTNLVQGVNQLAVEVHQQSTTSSDVVFGLSLDEVLNSVVSTNATVVPPTVALTSPAAGAAADVGATVSIAATVTPAAGATITKVEFFDGTTKLGEDTTAPYSLNWTAAVVGAHTLKAVATDSKGATGEASVSITVNAVVAPPKITIATSKGVTTLSWPVSTGYALESTTSITSGVWTAVSGATATGYTVPANAPAVIYYRLRKP